MLLEIQAGVARSWKLTLSPATGFSVSVFSDILQSVYSFLAIVVVVLNQLGMLLTQRLVSASQSWRG